MNFLNFQPHLRFPSHDTIVTLLLFSCVIILAWVKINNPKRIPALVTGFFKGGTTEENTISPDSIALFLVFIVSLSVISNQWSIVSLNAGVSNNTFTLTLALFILAWYLLKTIAILLCGFMFRVQNQARDYINEIYVFTNLAGIILLPLAILYTYSHQLLANSPNAFSGLIGGILALLICYRTIKMFILMTNRGLNVVYLILYLCAVEISPLVLTYEFIKSNLVI